MTEFNTFDQRPENNEPEDEDAIARRIVDIQSRMAGLKVEIDSQKVFEDLANADIERIKKMLKEAEAKKEALKTEVFDVQRELRDLNRQVEAEKNALVQAQRNKAIREEVAALTNQFDELIKGLAWREWAFDHQMSGAKHMAIASRCINADKMGLGKSIQSLMASDMLEAKRILVIAPKDVAENYGREVSKWAPHRDKIVLLGNNQGERNLMLEMILPKMEQFTLITNYEVWRKDKTVIDKFIALKFDTIILDEAHTLKNLKSVAFRGVRKIIYSPNVCPKCGARPDYQVNEHNGNQVLVCPTDGCSTIYIPGTEGGFSGGVPDTDKYCSIKNVFPLTGTPILNRPQDLYPLLHLIDRQTFDSEDKYLRAYCEKDYYTGKWRFRYGGLESLSKRIAANFISRDRYSAGIKIPPQDIQQHFIEMDKELYSDQFEFLTLLKERAMLKMNSKQGLPVTAMIALITRQRQGAVWPNGISAQAMEDGELLDLQAECDQSIKLDYVLARPYSEGTQMNNAESSDWSGLLYDLTQPDLGRDEGTKRFIGERVVVASQFKTALAELERRCKNAGISVVRYDGDTKPELRKEIQTDFDAYTYKSDPNYQMRWQVVLINYKTGGQGLNINAASQMIELDSEWNAGKTDQARGRIDRIGQTEETTVHRILLNRSIELWMDALVNEKRAMVDGFESNMDIAGQLLEAIRSGEVEM